LSRGEKKKIVFFLFFFLKAVKNKKDFTKLEIIKEQKKIWQKK
jgi:hypothetical protein